MNYFVTGATGFIGKFLLEQLLKRDNAKVYVLVRESSKDKIDALKHRYGDAGKNLIAMYGDITTPGLVSAADFKKLKGQIDHVFHLAAVYDMNMDDATGDRINNEGTRNLVAFCNDLGGKVRLFVERGGAPNELSPGAVAEQAITLPVLTRAARAR